MPTYTIHYSKLYKEPNRKYREAKTARKVQPKLAEFFRKAGYQTELLTPESHTVMIINPPLLVQLPTTFSTD